MTQNLLETSLAQRLPIWTDHPVGNSWRTTSYFNYALYYGTGSLAERGSVSKKWKKSCRANTALGDVGGHQNGLLNRRRNHGEGCA
jgi:hypothetical protein